MEELTRKDIAAIRKRVKAEFPNLKFSIKKVSFRGFGYGEKHFLESDEWGMCQVGSHNLFNAVEALVNDKRVCVSW